MIQRLDSLKVNVSVLMISFWSTKHWWSRGCPSSPLKQMRMKWAPNSHTMNNHGNFSATYSQCNYKHQTHEPTFSVSQCKLSSMWIFDEVTSWGKINTIRNNCHGSTCFQLNFVVIEQTVIGIRCFDDHLTSIYRPSSGVIHDVKSIPESLILPN